MNKPRHISKQSRRPVRWLAATVALLAVGLFCSSVSAATVLRLDMQSLVANSDKIVYGTVEDVESREENGRIYTYTTIDIRESVKGDGGDSVVIRQLGGETPELATVVAGMPRFREGEQVVTFLEQTKDPDFYVVTGMMQGKFKVVLGPDGATRHVVPYLGDLSLVEEIEPAGGVPNESGGQSDSGEVGPSIQPSQPADLYRSIQSFEHFMDRVRSVVRDQQDSE